MEEEIVDKVYKNAILLIQAYDCREHGKCFELIKTMQSELELVKSEVQKRLEINS